MMIDHRRVLDLTRRIKSLNHGLGVECRIRKNPLIVEFRPRKNPLFPEIPFRSNLDNKIIFIRVSPKEVLVRYKEVFPLDVWRQVFSVREKLVVLKYSSFVQIMSMFKTKKKGGLTENISHSLQEKEVK